jgi:hypothetical protein
MTKTKRIIITLDETKERALSFIMSEDMETNVSGYLGRLIVEKFKDRQGSSGKKLVGRPKKTVADDDTNLYPAPYKGGGAYTRSDLEGWYEFRGLPVPDLPAPLTAEEIAKFS